ncbi:leucine-rich repeat protein kinase family protein [Striga asiatica]|uniref:Leucine-rich repeat protein kinase family protein n=1 Tax=Striga asiatica TaxID=4170 RepID=A0A5A7PTW4_STRAF|nr:leucine-rich repeat protein kinase family protein [Striga asiatica]
MAVLPLLLLSLFPVALSFPTPFNYSLHIDCGGLVNTSDAFRTSWLADRYFTGGAASVVSEPLIFRHQQEKTLRYFPVSFGKKNCYSVPVPAGGGRYLLRTFTAYDNYDGKSHSPSFDVAVGGTVVFSWRYPWLESTSRYGAYSDLIFHNNESAIDVCFYSFGTDSPVIGSLELTQIDPYAYPLPYASKNSSDYILINYGRFSSATEQWGPGFTNDTDVFGRSWQSETLFRADADSFPDGPTVRSISALKPISRVELSPNYFPEKLYRTASTPAGNESGGVLEYELQVDARLDYLLYFHFAEIDGSVTRAGQRVFDVLVNEENVNRVDVYDKVGAFAAYDWSYVVKNLSNTVLNVKLQSVVGSPVICGLENYAIVPVDVETAPDQVAAMKALKESLRVPDRMGWNGDPCAPATWDAWEGVTCHASKDGSTLVVSQIDLGSQGLKGHISEKIGLLTNLVSLNLSSNSLEGNIPPGLGQKSLVKLFLNDNLLEGRVPEELYSIGVHGGAIDLEGNKRLCGVPSLPDCSVLWGKEGLSTGGKVAIALSCLVIISVVAVGVYYFVVWRHRNDYDFSFPHELLSLASKRNRYQRQKSLMTLEMESQHAKKGFIPTYNVS